MKTPAGLKLTGDLRDENTGHLEREARGEKPGNEIDLQFDVPR